MNDKDLVFKSNFLNRAVSLIVVVLIYFLLLFTFLLPISGAIGMAFSYLVPEGADARIKILITVIFGLITFFFFIKRLWQFFKPKLVGTLSLRADSLVLGGGIVKFEVPYKDIVSFEHITTDSVSPMATDYLKITASKKKWTLALLKEDIEVITSVLGELNSNAVYIDVLGRVKTASTPDDVNTSNSNMRRTLKNRILQKTIVAFLSLCYAILMTVAVATSSNTESRGGAVWATFICYLLGIFTLIDLRRLYKQVKKYK